MAGWGSYFGDYGLSNQASSGQVSQMGMGPFEYSGNNFSAQLAEMARRQNEMVMRMRSKISPAKILGPASLPPREPSLDDGLLAYLRARKKAWLDGVKVK